jgi:hypothetical protein
MTKEYSTVDRQDYIPAFFLEPTQIRPFDRWLWRWDGRTGKRLSNIHWLASRAIRFLRVLLWGSQVCGIAQEFCSLPRRIGTIYATKIYRRGVRLGSLGGSKEQILNERTLACNRDMQHITTLYRWATPLDLAVYVEVWKLGAAWAESVSGIHQLDTIDMRLQAFNTPSRACSFAGAKYTPKM